MNEEGQHDHVITNLLQGYLKEWLNRPRSRRYFPENVSHSKLQNQVQVYTLSPELRPLSYGQPTLHQPIALLCLAFEIDIVGDWSCTLVAAGSNTCIPRSGTCPEKRKRTYPKRSVPSLGSALNQPSD